MKRGEVSRDFLPAVSPKYFFSKPKIFEIDSNGGDLTNVLSLKELPSLSVCLDIRSKLTRKELEGGGINDAIDLERQHNPVQKFGVEIPGLGKFDRDSVQEIVHLHDLRRVVREVEEERLWLESMRRHLQHTSTSFLMDSVECFLSELWCKEESGKVFGHMFVRDAVRLCCDRWFSDDLIEQFFMKLNAASQSHMFLVFSELMKDAKILNRSILQKLTPEVKFIHFAVNIRGSDTKDQKCGVMETSITTGNHWVYVVVKADGTEIIYGDPKGWGVPNNFKACFEPLIVMLKERSGQPKSTLKLTRMHVPCAGIDHSCVKECSQLFPVQTCHSLCGGIVVLIATLALCDVDLWGEMILKRNCSRPGKERAVRNFLRYPSSNSYIARALLISWIASVNIPEVGFKPLIQSKLSTADEDICTQGFTYDETEFPLLTSPKYGTEKTPCQAPTKVRDFEMKEVKSGNKGADISFPKRTGENRDSQSEKRQHNLEENCNISTNEIRRTKRKYTDTVESAAGHQKSSKIREENTDEIEQLPFRRLSKKWYGLQAVKIERESEASLPFPALSRTWYGKHDVSYSSHEGSSKDECGTNCSSKCVPLKGMSRKWYRRRGELYQKNRSRAKTVRAHGSIKENIECLEEEKRNDHSLGPRKTEEITKMIEVGHFIEKHGPVIPTQEIGKLLSKSGNKLGQNEKSRRPFSAEIYKRIQRHLNVIQVYVRGTGFLIENKGQLLPEVAQRLEEIAGNIKGEINSSIASNIGSLLKTSLNFADTKKDADLIKGLFAKATSIKFVSKVLNVKNKNSIRSAKDEIDFKLAEYKKLEFSSQIVRNDMTNEQQRRATRRMVEKRKQSAFKLKFDTRGRPLLADLYPELGMVLEEIFTHGNDGMLGGLESHPRLTSEVMYRSEDNTLYMRQARDILLKVAPPGFGISLKSCYNYTESYKGKTHSAKRHHEGRGVNANISLQCPPRIGVSKHVVNLHWTTKNVNLMLEGEENNQDDCVIDSKDAKTIICGDIQPVQNPGKSWKAITYEDHTFNQSRTNAVYPMTHLFLDNSDNTRKTSEDQRQIEITRTGQAVLLVNIAITEHETTFRAMNEMFYLLTLPALDRIFRNPSTGALKSVLSFLVDNGHGEDPDSPLTQMCMARMLKLLKLSKISQRSFAEYHSKRNFVERVHAVENTALSRHGAFSSHQIHHVAETGSPEHMQNMEKMAEDVRQCLSQARFGKTFLNCYRGIKNDAVFDDEEQMKEFLKLSEERKEECQWTYKPREGSNSHFEALVQAWGVPEKYEGSYAEDYSLIINSGEQLTSWKDKYSTTIYGTENEKNFELQPIPDYASWFKSEGELHYLSYEKTNLLHSTTDIKFPALFLPSRILDLFFVMDSDPSEDIIRDIAILAWLPTDDVKKYYKLKLEKANKEFKQDVKRETWRSHKLYKKSLADLQQQCKSSGVPSNGQKHELVERLALKSGENHPTYDSHAIQVPTSLPKSISEIRKLPIPTLKHILKSYAMSICGRKDDLVLRVYLLRHGRAHLAFNEEKHHISCCIKEAKKIVAEQTKDYIMEHDDVKRVRAHRTQLKEKSKVDLPTHITQISDLHGLFDPLTDYVSNCHKSRMTNTQETDNGASVPEESNAWIHDEEYERFFEVGNQVKVRWTKEEVGGMGWRPGWYSAEVQEADIAADQITLVYLSEPDSVYTCEVTLLLAEGKLKLL